MSPEQEFLLQRRELLRQNPTHMSRRKFSSLQGKMVVCRKEFATFYKQVGRLLVSFLMVGVVSVTHLCLFRTAARVTRVVGITTEETRVSFALISTTTRYGCQQVGPHLGRELQPCEESCGREGRRAHGQQ